MLEATVYIVATPIGNLGDISQRALETLKKVDLIFAEDTRNTRKLLTHFGIQTKLSSLHEHNEAEKTQAILQRLEKGEQLALVSDAGTPLISDPGYRMVKEVGVKGFKITPIPGASAVITALSIAGLPTERFTFEGFLPSKPKTRRACLEKNKTEERTQVYYESSHRIEQSVKDMSDILGADREVTLARELTKLYEDIYRGTLGGLIKWLQEKSVRQKGEFVVVVNGAELKPQTHEALVAVDNLLNILLEELPVKQAVSLAAKITGEAKNKVYKRALNIKKS